SQVAGAGLRILVPRFTAALGRSEALRDMMARYHGHLLTQAQQTAACNALHGVEARFCRWLLQTQDRIDGRDAGKIPLTQEFLAQMLGVQRATVTVVAH